MGLQRGRTRRVLRRQHDRPSGRAPIDPYAVLGIGRSATPGEIREAYLRRSKELHPDRLVGATDQQRAAATRAMQDVTAAYELLRDRSASDASSPHDVPAAWPPPSPSPRRTRTIVIFLALLAVMSGLVLAGSGSSAPAPDPGRDDDLSGLKGRCITLRPSGAFEDVVDCTRPHDARVIEVVDREQPCPLWADRSLAGSKQQLCLDIVFSG